MVLSKEQQTHLRDFINIVRDNNVHVDLPEMAVVGDTSAGKSSLISAATGVILPSSADICTRCPTRISMEHADFFKCTVRIKWADDVSDRLQSTHPEECTLKELTDKIAELQKEILEKDPSAQGKENGISRSVIDVRLEGPKYHNFTVTDLPGIVKTTGSNENTSIIGQIDALLDEYIKNPRCIIIAVHPANVDFHNSEIFERVMKYDPHTSRTLPVVTKADKIGKGEEKGTIRLVNGEAKKFDLGFHLAKLRSQEEVDNDVDMADVISGEMNWFRTSLFAGSIEPKSFGIENLKSRLSRLYIGHLQNNIDAVIADIKKRLQQCEKDFKALGPDVSSPADRIRIHNAFVNRMFDKVSKLLQGTQHVDVSAEKDGENTPLLTIRAILEEKKRQFQINIIPKDFKQLQVGDKVYKVIDGELVLCEVVAIKPNAASDGNENAPSCFCAIKGVGYWKQSFRSLYDDQTLAATDRAVAAYTSPNTDAVIRVDPKNPGNAIFRSDLTSFPVGTDPLLRHCFMKFRLFPDTELHPCYDTIAQEIRSNRQRSMPIFEGEPVFLHHVRKWIDTEVRSATTQLLDEFEDLVRKNVLEITSVVNGKNPELQLYVGLNVAVEASVEEALSKWMDFLRANVDRLLQREKNPETKNHYFSTTILKLRYKLFEEMLLSKQRAENGETGKKVVDVSDIENILNSSSQNKDLILFVAQEVAVTLKAYYKVARKNIVDQMAKILDASLEVPLGSSSFSVNVDSSLSAFGNNDGDDDDGDDAVAGEDDKKILRSLAASRNHQAAVAAVSGQGQALAEILRSELQSQDGDSLLEDESAAAHRRRVKKELDGLKKTFLQLPKLKTSLAKKY